MKENTLVHKLTKILLDILIVVGAVCTLGSYWLARTLQMLGEHGASVIIPFALMLLISGSLAVFILVLLRRMFKTLLNDDPFVEENISSLRKIAVASAIISLIYFLKCFFVFTFMTLAVTVTFCIAALFCLTLKDVFKRAYILRRDNDLTI
ncbi:MAG: DUF2975 domain-containing protein [Oscillospiraceae bacterium]|nr:DUF2975 domain-containing protein [Oscillospiraceae bacterium]